MITIDNIKAIGLIIGIIIFIICIQFIWFILSEVFWLLYGLVILAFEKLVEIKDEVLWGIEDCFAFCRDTVMALILNSWSYRILFKFLIVSTYIIGVKL